VKECAEENIKYRYVPISVISSLSDGLYIFIFFDPNNDPVVKKFNRITREKQ